MRRRSGGPLINSQDPRLVRFEQYAESDRYQDGLLNAEHREFWFANGYVASAICTPTSYGGKAGLWEVVMAKGAPDNDEPEIIHEHPLMPRGGAAGWLKWEQVQELLGQIADYREPREPLWPRVRDALVETYYIWRRL